MGQLDTFLWEEIFFFFAHFYFGLIVFFLLICSSSLYIPDMNLSLYYILQISSPILWLDYFLYQYWRTEVLNFIETQFIKKISFYFHSFFFCVCIEEAYAYAQVKKISFYESSRSCIIYLPHWYLWYISN